MTRRSDTHKPSLLDPAEYEFLGCFYQGSSKAMQISYMSDEVELERNIERTSARQFSGNHVAKTTCDHCGAAFAHGVVFLHTPTGEYISVGHICASETIGLPSHAAVAKRSAERAAAEEKARQERFDANAAWREKNADIVEFLAGVEQTETDWRNWNEEHPDAGHPDDNGPRKNPIRAPHHFLTDMVHTLNRWGNLSEKQAAATRKFIASETARAARPAPEQEPEPTTPLIEGRRVITGTVITTKWKEGYNGGSTLKWLVKEADGNKVWGTVPEAAWAVFEAQTNDDFQGVKVTFTAAVERSRDDEHFGFYKRPTNTAKVS